MSAQEPTGQPAPETGPAPAVPVLAAPGFITLRVVLGGHDDGPPVEQYGPDVRHVLESDGFDVERVDYLPATSVADGPPPGMVEGWPMDARQLETLLAEVASARRRATVAYAEAFLSAEGTQLAREATAQLAAAGPRAELETLEGRAEAFRMVLGSARLTVAREATQALISRSRA